MESNTILTRDMFDSYNEYTENVSYADIEEFIEAFSTDYIRGIVYEGKLYALTVEQKRVWLADPLVRDKHGYKMLEKSNCSTNDLDVLPSYKWHTFADKSLAELFDKLQFPSL